MKIRVRNGIEYVYDNKNRYIGRKDKMPVVCLTSLEDKFKDDTDDFICLNEMFYKAFMEQLLFCFYGIRDEMLADPTKYGLSGANRVDPFLQTWFNKIQEYSNIHGIPSGVLDRLESAIRIAVKQGRFNGDKMSKNDLDSLFKKG